MRKRAICAIFLISFFSYSCSPQCHQWKLAVIKADCPSASYVKVYLPACNTFNGLEAVLMSCNGNINLYLNAHTLLFPTIGCDECHSEIMMCIEEEKYQFTADRLQGGQCLLLPDDAMQLVVCSLLEKKCVEITVGRYQTILTHENFDKTYETLTCEM